VVGGWRLVTVCGRTRLRAYSYETQPQRRQQRVLEPTGEFPNGRKRDGNGGGGNCVRQDGSERGEARRRKRKRRCREEGPGRLDGEQQAWPVSQPRMQVRAILQQNTGWMENRSGGGQGPASQPASQTMGGAMSDGTGARAIWPGTARRERESARRPSVHCAKRTRFPGETHQRRTVPSAAKRCARHSVSPVSGQRRSSFGGQAPSPSAWVEPQTGEMICATGARAGARWSPLETAGGVAARAQQHAIAVPLAPACQGMLREAQGGTEKPSWAPPAGPT